MPESLCPLFHHFQARSEDEHEPFSRDRNGNGGLFCSLDVLVLCDSLWLGGSELSSFGSRVSPDIPGDIQRRHNSVIGIFCRAASARNARQSDKGMKIEICFRNSVVVIVCSSEDHLYARKFIESDPTSKSECLSSWSTLGDRYRHFFHELPVQWRNVSIHNGDLSLSRLLDFLRPPILSSGGD